MRTYQFTVAEQQEGVWVEVPDLLTPAITAATPTEAMTHPDMVQWFVDKPNYRLFRQVR